MKRVTRVKEAIARLQAVFLDAPGTRLSSAQAIMLAGLEQPMGESVLEALEQAEFLRRDLKGLYHLHTGDPMMSGEIARNAHG